VAFDEFNTLICGSRVGVAVEVLVDVEVMVGVGVSVAGSCINTLGW
jgi:hypothetical protein